MQTNLALRNTLHNPQKTALSLAGIGIAILLVFMQLGFRGAVENTATNIYDKLDFDVLLRSADYLHFIDSGKIPRDALDEAASLTGVESVRPLNVGLRSWRNPQSGISRGMLVLGVSPTMSPFLDTAVDGEFDKLRTHEQVLVDRKSHRDFGASNGERFTDADVGLQTELGDRQVEVVGLFVLGGGLAANGVAITNEDGFQRQFPMLPAEMISFGLVKLKPGVAPDQFIAELSQKVAMPDDGGLSLPFQILARDQVRQSELNRWLGETPIGFIFTLGVVIAIIVGAAIVYMVLGNDVAARLHEYATLKAMGYSNFYMASTVLMQAGYLAVFSFVPALGLAILLYSLTGALANLTMEMTTGRVLFVLLMTLLMCGFSGTLALNKLWKAEPAELF